MKRLLLTLALVLASTQVHAQPADQLDLRQAVIHNSPDDVAGWTIRTGIKEIAMSPAVGFTVTADTPDSWNFHVPGWGSGAGCPNDGCVLYTVWLVVNVGGRWHASGFVQMWTGRPSTGAFETSAWTTEYPKNYAYARDRWGEMVDYRPHPGDTVGLFISAGNARNERAVTSARERSNVVLFRLPEHDTGGAEFDVAPLAPIVTPPPPAPVAVAPLPPVVYSPPPPPVLTSTDLSPVLNQLAVEAATRAAQLRELEAYIAARIDEVRGDIKTIKDAVSGALQFVVKYVAPLAGPIIAALMARGAK